MEQSVVEWCEAYTDQYSYSNYIAEYSNTISNLAFIFISLLSIYQFNHKLFQRCNITLLLVGVGSAVFHATDTYLGQVLDELPMSILMYYYISIVCHLQKWKFHRIIYLGLATLCWSLYLTFRIYIIFISLFVIQLIIPILIIIFQIKKTPEQKRLLMWSALLTIIAKSCWIYERYLHATFHCPSKMTEPAYYLHSYWHIGIAISHYLLMKTLFIIMKQDALIYNQI